MGCVSSRNAQEPLHPVASTAKQTEHLSNGNSSIPPTAVETGRDSSFCAWTLLPLHPEVLVVQDAQEDVRFKDNPLVLGDPFIRFYAGAPLVTSTGHRLGSLCLIDRKPRVFDAENCNLLCNFAEVVVREIEKERLRMSENMRISRQTSGLLRAMDCFSEGIMLVDTSLPMWRIMFINDAWTRITGIHKEEAMADGLWQLFEVTHTSKGEALAAYNATVAKQVAFTVDLLRHNPDGSVIRVLANFRPAATKALDSSMPLIGIPGSVEWHSENAEAYYFATVQVKRSSMEEVAPQFRPHTLLPKKEPFDDVQLGPLLGQGAFGRVYRGIWNGAVVAIKIIQHSGAGGRATRAGAGSGDGVGTAESLEAVLTTELAHPNVVRTFKSTTRPMQSLSSDALAYGGGPPGLEAAARFNETWLVLEFCDKGCLQDAVDRGWFTIKNSVGPAGKPLPDVGKVVNTAREIAGAMWYLHSHNILHGDLAGGNILLVSSDKDSRGFSVKVADFGLSRVLSQESISTGTYGTVTHMPPELLTTGQLSKATDVYAFGVLLWEMYTGQRPWGGLLQMQIIFHVTIQNKKLEFPADAPPFLVQLAARCMDSDPDKRPKFEEIMKILGFDQL
ncbi:hypothetical protein WJX72_004554 [[Myrmecia] bisecta]|uniref:Protein kinase domain-containing protein n=1 Tax=[Myrmecia] bisecta TaxID=41462 RepID=A0AAW1PG56_9CHLO